MPKTQTEQPKKPQSIAEILNEVLSKAEFHDDESVQDNSASEISDTKFVETTDQKVDQNGEDIERQLKIIQALIADKSEIYPLQEDKTSSDVSKFEHNDIVRILLSDLKAHFKKYPEHNKFIAIDVAKLNTKLNLEIDFKKIKLSILYVPIKARFDKACYALTVIGQDNVQQHYLIPKLKANEFRHAMETMLRKLPDDCVEIGISKNARTKIQPLKKEFWSATGKWSTDKELSKNYQQYIDPISLNEFKEIINNAKRANKTELTVLDAGGGKGRIAEKFLQESTNENVSLTLIFIEPDKSQFLIAEEKLNNYREKNCILMINQTLEAFDYDNYKEKVDVIFSSGGPLNVQVVSYDEAQRNLVMMKEMLKKDGRIIATGLSSLALKKKEMEQAGFSVLKTSVPKKGGVGLYEIRQQLYLLKKMDVDKDKKQDEINPKEEIDSAKREPEIFDRNIKKDQPLADANNDWKEFEKLWDDLTNRERSFRDRVRMLFEHYDRQSSLTLFGSNLTSKSSTFPGIKNNICQHAKFVNELTDKCRSEESKSWEMKGEFENKILNFLTTHECVTKEMQDANSSGRLRTMIDFVKAKCSEDIVEKSCSNNQKIKLGQSV